MKASDSTNSLTELTEVISEIECFICLELQNELQEPLVDSKFLRTCGCKFVVHPKCWNTWMEDKTDWDCPICRRKSLDTANIIPNPVIAFTHQSETNEYNMIATYVGIVMISIIIIFTIIFLTRPK